MSIIIKDKKWLSYEQEEYLLVAAFPHSRNIR